MDSFASQAFVQVAAFGVLSLLMLLAMIVERDP